MKKILFICAGNVARSQMAEAFYNYFTDSLDAISAGVLDFTPAKYGHPIPEVVEVMQEEGIDVSQKKVKTVTAGMVKTVDDIYVLCPEEKVPEFVTDRGSVIYWEIKDPFDSSTENFRMIRDVIKEKVKKIIIFQ
ncbi:MAG: low molecular weight phosphatase family protein [Patescibacteria group bacterium]